MPFSFNPGQEQGQVAAPSAPQQNNGVPTLMVPTIPSIVDGGNVQETISPFAFRNRNKSDFPVYFQFAILFIFGVASLASAGLFGYQLILKAQINSKKETIATMQASFKNPGIDEMLRLSSRLSLINKIVNERASVRTALTIVEESIKDDVTYNKFTLSKSNKYDGYDINFNGETTSYESLYQQIEILNSEDFGEIFRKISITGVGPLDKKGIASFKVNGVVAIGGIDPDTFTITRKGDQTNSSSESSEPSSPENILEVNTISSTSSQNVPTSTLNVIQ
ncbi:hypothetical protein K9M47_02440 [Candidatus Gracilibacteria bacterium]|nr:hypothetical protein [Candidatus Gracilibacteria bacterium]MCF7898884.1 hypothetical protein [Candidatus Paceibacterota bacterium]